MIGGLGAVERGGAGDRRARHLDAVGVAAAAQPPPPLRGRAGDHDDHIHVGFRPLYGTNRTAARQVDAVLKPQQWIRLIEQLGKIENPKVRSKPSQYATDAGERASTAHKGE